MPQSVTTVQCHTPQSNATCHCHMPHATTKCYMPPPNATATATAKCQMSNATCHMPNATVKHHSQTPQSNTTVKCQAPQPNATAECHSQMPQPNTTPTAYQDNMDKYKQQQQQQPNQLPHQWPHQQPPQEWHECKKSEVFVEITYSATSLAYSTCTYPVLSYNNNSWVGLGNTRDVLFSNRFKGADDCAELSKKRKK